MARTLTNEFSLSYTVETALGVPGVTWFLLEPNEITSFGAVTTVVERNPISKSRQRNKGVVTDLTSGVEISSDLGMSAFTDFIEGFCFAKAVNDDMVFKPTQGVIDISAGSLTYTVPALTAGQVAKLRPESLIFVRGFVNDLFNGVKRILTNPVAGATIIVLDGYFSGDDITEIAPAGAEMEYSGLCGVGSGEDDLSIVVTNGVGVITVANKTSLDFTLSGLTVGQFIYVGGLIEAERIGNSFGFGRVIAFTDLTITLDKLDATVVTDDGNQDKACLLWGRFIRNVDVDNAAYIKKSFQFEGAFEKLGANGVTEYEYSKGNFCNTMTFDLPITDKATLAVGFVGTDTDPPVPDRKQGAGTASLPNKTAPFNTSTDIARLRITKVDETGLTTDFKSLSITINNGVTPENVLGTLGAKYLNVANFLVDIESQILFTDAGVVRAIRENETLTMDFAVKNAEGAIYFDLPSMTLEGGGKDFAVDESVLLNGTAKTFKDATLGTSIGVSLFPVVPQ